MIQSPQVFIRDAERSDARGIAEVHALAWKTTYRGLIPDSVLDGMSAEAGTPHFEKAIERHLTEDLAYPFLVALLDERVVGFSWAVKPIEAPTGFDCEIKAIYLDPRHQRKGMGRALILESVRRLEAAGHQALIIWAATENPWRQFYQKMGGIVLPETKQPEVGGRPIPHVAYGWRDLGVLRD